MRINLFGYELSFGKKPKNIERNTINTMFTFFPVGLKKQTIAKPNSTTLRNFAQSAIPRRAINIIKDGLFSLPWRIVPVKLEDADKYNFEISVIENILNNPNDTDTFKTLFGAVIEDMLVGDCGAAEIVATKKLDKPLYLFPVDGFTLEFVAGWDSSTPDYPRFAQTAKNGEKIYFNDQDILYVKKNNFTHVPWGLSPLESAFMYIDYLLKVNKYSGTAASKGVPKFMINLGENITEAQLIAFRKYMEEEINGTSTIPIVGGAKGIGSMQIGAINDDGLYLEWQKFLITIISFTFGVDPKKLGMGSATDRSTVEEQNENVLNEAVKPYAELLAEAINKKIINRLGLGNVLRFEFVYNPTLKQKKQANDIVIAQWKADAITQNEMRALLGLPPRDSKYADLTLSEMKAAINSDYNIGGGFNGVGINRKENISSEGGESTDEYPVHVKFTKLQI